MGEGGFRRSERRFWVDGGEKGVRVPRGPKGEVPGTGVDADGRLFLCGFGMGGMGWMDRGGLAVVLQDRETDQITFHRTK